MTIDKLIRGKRQKRISIEVSLSGEVIVKAPAKTSSRVIDQFVLDTLPWIHKQKQKAKQRVKPAGTRSFIAGELFLYLGEHYPLTIVPPSREPLRLWGEFQLSENYQPMARAVFMEWYQARAREKFKERLVWYSRLTGFTYKKLKLTSATTRWGSCSSDGNINIHWRLIMAPLAVIDYVIVHELAHTQELNHSKAFWDHVQGLLPDYKTCRQWLQDFGQLLVL